MFLKILGYTASVFAILLGILIGLIAAIFGFPLYYIVTLLFFLFAVGAAPISRRWIPALRSASKTMALLSTCIVASIILLMIGTMEGIWQTDRKDEITYARAQRQQRLDEPAKAQALFGWCQARLGGIYYHPDLITMADYKTYVDRESESFTLVGHLTADSGHYNTRFYCKEWGDTDDRTSEIEDQLKTKEDKGTFEALWGDTGSVEIAHGGPLVLARGGAAAAK